MSFEQKFTTTKQARFFQSAEFNAQTKSCVIVLHGYAQHADYFLRKFESLYNAQTVFIAPEGLSRFYAKGASGKVVASWMTSENRQDEISDYVHYLDKVLEYVPVKIPITIVGFSQGAASMSRWVSLGKVKPVKVIFHSSVFPPDLPPDHHPDKWSQIDVAVVCGDTDEYYSSNELIAQFESNQSVFRSLTPCIFSGGHEINPSILRPLIEKM